MNEAHGVVLDIVGLQGADEELVVCSMDGIAALERQDVRSFGQGCTNLGRSSALENARRLLEALNLHMQALLGTAAGNTARELWWNA